MPKSLPDQLLEAADRLDELSRSDIQVLLRRAVLRVGNKAQAFGTTVLPHEIVEHVDHFAESKHISRGTGGVNLISWNAPAIEDVRLDWIGEIFAVLPPSVLRKVERMGGIQGQLRLKSA